MSMLSIYMVIEYKKILNIIISMHMVVVFKPYLIYLSEIGYPLVTFFARYLLINVKRLVNIFMRRLPFPNTNYYSVCLDKHIFPVAIYWLVYHIISTFVHEPHVYLLYTAVVLYIHV